MNAFGLVSRLLTSVGRTADTNKAQIRVSPFGEIINAPPFYLSGAVDGSLFFTTNATIGTAVAINAAAQATFSATAPTFLIRNTDTLKDITVRNLRLICSAIGTGVTSLDCLITTDTLNRYSSGGLLRTPLNVRADQSAASISQVYDATTAIVATAAGASARNVGRGKIRTGSPNIGDVYGLLFGNDNIPEMGSLTGTTAQKITVNLPPFIVPPGGTGLVYIWGAGQTAAPTYEYNIEHNER